MGWRPHGVRALTFKVSGFLGESIEMARRLVVLFSRPSRFSTRLWAAVHGEGVIRDAAALCHAAVSHFELRIELGTQMDSQARRGHGGHGGEPWAGGICAG